MAPPLGDWIAEALAPTTCWPSISKAAPRTIPISQAPFRKAAQVPLVRSYRSIPSVGATKRQPPVVHAATDCDFPAQASVAPAATM